MRKFQGDNNVVLIKILNYGKDAAKALEYINKVVVMEPANENYKKIKEQIEKSVKSGPRSSNESRSSSSGTTGSTPKEKREG